jgi:hypothetical protein
MKIKLHMSKMRGQIWMQWQLPWNQLRDVKVLGLDKSFQDLFLLAMFFLRLASMLHLMKRFAKTSYLFPSSLPSQICKNV